MESNDPMNNRYALSIPSPQEVGLFCEARDCAFEFSSWNPKLCDHDHLHLIRIFFSTVRFKEPASTWGGAEISKTFCSKDWCTMQSFLSVKSGLFINLPDYADINDTYALIMMAISHGARCLGPSPVPSVWRDKNLLHYYIWSAIALYRNNLKVGHVPFVSLFETGYRTKPIVNAMRRFSVFLQASLAPAITNFKLTLVGTLQSRTVPIPLLYIKESHASTNLKFGLLLCTSTAGDLGRNDWITFKFTQS